MQSFPENSTFLCADCKAQFNSAALLLNHFSRHIHMLAKLEAPSQNIHNLANDPVLKKRNFAFSPSKVSNKSESILEQVLRQSLLDVSSCDSNQVESSLTPSESSENDPCSVDNENQLPLPVLEIGQSSSSRSNSPSDMLLAKFDLQQRLENCILNLSSKKESCVARNNLSKSTKTLQNSRVSSSKNTADHDDFNPLTYCVVTMEEGEENIQLDSIKTELTVCPASKMASNRKQKTPRKIPSVENVPVKMEVTEREKQEETLTKSPKKKYPCNVCWKVFGWSTDLKRHVLTHTGERPFKCHQCTATFTRNFLLQKHEMKAHQGMLASNEPSSTCLQAAGNDHLALNEDLTGEGTHGSAVKRQKINPQNWNKKQMVYKSIPLGRFTPKALDIS